MMPHRLFYLQKMFLYSLFTVLLLVGSVACDAHDRGFKPGTDTGRINRLIREGCRHSNPDSGIFLLGIAFQRSADAQYWLGMHNCQVNTAIIYYSQADFARALDFFIRSLPYCSDGEDSAATYYNIANTYMVMGDITQSAEFCYKALVPAARCNASLCNQYVVETYNLLSSLYNTLGQQQEARKYLDLAEKAARQHQLYRQLITVLNNKGGKFREAGKLDSAFLYLLESQQLTRKHNLFFLEGEVLEELGMAYLDSGKHQEALTCFRSSMDTAKCSDDYQFICYYSSYGIAKTLYALGRYQEARTTLEKSVQKGKDLGITTNNVDEFRLLVRICRQVGDFRAAADYADTLVHLIETAATAEKATVVSRLEGKFHLAEKDKQLTQSRLVIEAQKNKIARKNIMMISVSGGLILLIILSGTILLQMMHKQRSREKESRIAVLHAAVQASDQERSRIARDLHDGIGGMLSASMMRLSSLHHENQAITETRAYKDAMAILGDMGEEIRKTAHNLMPDVLLQQSLPDAVRTFCFSVASGNEHLSVDFQSFGDFDAMTAGDKLNLYRIIQELVKNVVAHARATKVLVQLMHTNDKLVASVEDNGVGFDVQGNAHGLGLSNIRTRVSSMGAHLIIESSPQKGTTVIVELPDQQ